MRWTVVRLIFCRELRDQLRDRRTIFMIVVLPLVLYPVFGMAVVQFAAGFEQKPAVIGIAGGHYLPSLTSTSGGFSVLPVAARLAATPAEPGTLGSGLDRLLGAAALVHAASLSWFRLGGRRVLGACFFVYESKSSRVPVLSGVGLSACHRGSLIRMVKIG